MKRVICSFAIILSLTIFTVAETPEATPAEAATTPQGEVIDAKDIEKLRAAIGQTVTVEGTIARTGNDSTSGINFLNFGTGRDGFVVVVFPSNVPSFPEPPEEMYRNRHVRVTGTVEDHQGKPQIVAKSPEQIKIVEETATPAE